jgi:hypothetical protein
MMDWLLIATLLAMVCLHWLSELLPRRERAAWCSEISLQPDPAGRHGDAAAPGDYESRLVPADHQWSRPIRLQCPGDARKMRGRWGC